MATRPLEQSLRSAMAEGSALMTAAVALDEQERELVLGMTSMVSRDAEAREVAPNAVALFEALEALVVLAATPGAVHSEPEKVSGL